MLLSRNELEETLAKANNAIEAIFAAATQAPAEYGAHARHLRNRATLFAYAYYAGVVKKWTPNARSILDWGGQYGHVTILLSKVLDRPVECYLVDCGEVERYWHRALKVSNIRTPRPGAPVGRIDRDDESVDVIVSSGVLEHTYDYGISDLDALRDIYRVLNKDGFLFIWHLPCKWGLPELINKALGRWYHPLRYDHDGLVCLLALAGFRIVKLDQHEIFHPIVRELMMRLFGNSIGLRLEYTISKLPIVRIFAQHFTVIAQKVPGFSFSSGVGGAVADDEGFGRSVVRE